MKNSSDIRTRRGFFASPVGMLELCERDGYLTELNFSSSPREEIAPALPLSPVLETCFQELHEYFRGTRRIFTIPLKLKGTPFQERVWQALREIPYGETRSYQDIALAVGNPKALRAVGGANHRNPVALIVPCHRVIGKDGSLTGFGGGLPIKKWLLEHEKQHAPGIPE